MPRQLICAYVDIIPDDVCRRAYPGRVTPNMLCAGVRNQRVDSCQVFLNFLGGWGAPPNPSSIFTHPPPPRPLGSQSCRRSHPPPRNKVGCFILGKNPKIYATPLSVVSPPKPKSNPKDPPPKIHILLPPPTLLSPQLHAPSTPKPCPYLGDFVPRVAPNTWTPPPKSVPHPPHSVPHPPNAAPSPLHRVTPGGRCPVTGPSKASCRGGCRPAPCRGARGFTPGCATTWTGS